MNPNIQTPNPAPETPTPVAEAMPQTNPQPLPMPAKKNSSGPLIGAAIIILILIAGALYFWSPLLISGQRGTAQDTTQDTTATTDSIGAEMQVSAAAASMDALQPGVEQDLNALGN
jgi:uncharacterized protein HemX